MERVSIRRAKRTDSAAFLKLVAALAHFERLDPPDQEGKRRLVADVFTKRRLGLFMAVAGKAPVGYALYYYSYSSFLARPTLYLEDVFVLEEHRGQGIGARLFRRCAEEALAQGCGRMEWAVLTWNKKAIEFYNRLGARRLDEWYVFRLTPDQIRSFARK